MAKIAARTHDALARVLALYGIEPTALRRIASGRMNAHWRVWANGQEFALRRYMSPAYLPRPRTRTSITFEHKALGHARSKGWPVPAPLPSEGGDTLVEIDGDFYALFPFLPGRPAPYRNYRYLRIKGRLLARLHRDMRSFPLRSQREGFGRVWELDDYLGNGVTFNELLRRFGQHQQALASAVRSQRYRNLRELSRLRYGELPDQFGHFDYHHDNLLFTAGELTALIDFDSAHRDARVSDIAVSIALDCREPPAHNATDPGAVRALIGGYAEGSPLTDQEVSLVVPLLQAWNIAGVAGRIGQWLREPDERALSSIMRTVVGRFPAFEQRRRALEAAVQEGAMEVRHS